MAALLTSDQGDIDRIAIEVAECRDMRIEVLAPNINESFEEFAVIVDLETNAEKIRFGLNAIKNVGHTVSREIVEERKRNGKFKSITDLIERVQTKDLNKKSIEALAKVGALDDLAERNQIISSIETILTHSKNFQRQKESKQESLFGAADLQLPEIHLAAAEPASKKERLSWEKELVGLYISDHPVKEYKEYFEKVAVPIKNIDSSLVGRNINVGGVISKIQKIYLKNQNAMLFVTIEDIDTKIEVLVFPKILETTASVWQEDKIVLVSGRVSDKDGVFKILADNVKAVTDAEIFQFKRILETQKKNGDHKSHPPKQKTKFIITLPPKSDQTVLKSISQYFNTCSTGNMKVFIDIGGTKIETPFCINYSPEIKTAIEKIIPEGKIETV